MVTSFNVGDTFSLINSSNNHTTPNTMIILTGLMIFTSYMTDEEKKILENVDFPIKVSINNLKNAPILISIDNTLNNKNPDLLEEKLPFIGDPFIVIDDHFLVKENPYIQLLLRGNNVIIDTILSHSKITSDLGLNNYDYIADSINTILSSHYCIPGLWLYYGYSDLYDNT